MFTFWNYGARPDDEHFELFPKPFRTDEVAAKVREVLSTGRVASQSAHLGFAGGTLFDQDHNAARNILTLNEGPVSISTHPETYIADKKNQFAYGTLTRYLNSEIVF